MSPPTDPTRDDAQTTDTETTMPETDKTTPPESPAPAPRPSVSAPPVPVAVQVLDRAVDLAAIAAVCWICLSGRLSGELAVVAIGAIAGAQTGLRSVLSARGGPSVGVAGLVLLAGLGVLSAPATAAAAGGVAAAAGAVGQRGSARVGVLVTVVLVALLPCAILACPKLPPPDGCTPAAWRCAGDRPERCSPGLRWTPVGDLPCGATGLVCVELADRARCAAGGAR